jgi:hypothetical protein
MVRCKYHRVTDSYMHEIDRGTEMYGDYHANSFVNAYE